MATLTSEIEKFAKDKRIEIDTLKIREEYRKDFLGNVSHELKTPLFTVQGYILTLLDGALEDKKVRKKYLQRANKGVERLIYIVKDLDLITKLEVGDLSLEISSFDIIELIQNVFDLLEMKASRRNIGLTFDMDYITPIYVWADRDKIQQVITNLVVNSIKYGLPGGTTEVSVENLIKNKVIVRVTDNGEGIPESQIQRIFERFYRIDKSGSRKEGGSGLGLSIVKHIIEAHGEKIYVESVVDVGSEFSFTLEKSKKQSA
jgi:two-component system phosphate regulon sensor histidine kinase PhoR